jgi:histidine ammonia-lyase
MILPTSDISLSALKDLFYASESLQLSDVAIQQIQKARTYLDSFSGENGAPVYGVNTGFGSLCNTIIKDDEMGLLQKNLLISHA